MANDLTYPNVPDVANAEAFDSDIEIQMLEAGAIKKMDSRIFRRLLSTSLIKSGPADPSAADAIADTNVMYLQTTNDVLFVSIAGTSFIQISGTDREAVHDIVDGLLTAGSNITLTYDDTAGTLTIAATDTNTQLSDEDLQDKIAAFIEAGNNVTVTYNDEAGTLTIDATPPGDSGGLTAEQVRDTIAAFIQAGTNVTITHNDEDDTLTIDASDTDTDTQLTAEQVRGIVAAFLQAGTNVTVSHDDENDTLTIAAQDTDTNTQLTDEEVQDKVAGFIQAGDNITLTYDDAAGTLTIASTVTQETRAVGQVTRLASWNIRSAASPTSGQIAISTPNTNLIFHDTDSDGTDQASTISELKANDQLLFGATHLFQVTSAAIAGTNTHTVGGVWQKGDPSQLAGNDGVSVWFLPSHRAIQPGAVKQFHLENDSVGLEQLAHGTPNKVRGWDSTGAPAEVDLPEEGTTQVGRVVSLGDWRLQSGDAIFNNGVFFHRDDIHDINELGLAAINRANADKSSDFQSLEVGDYIIIEGVNVLKITSIVIGSGAPKVVTINGEWEFDYSTSSTTTGDDYSFYIAKANDYIQASNVLQGDTLLGLDENLQVEYVPRGVRGQDDSDDADEEIQTGFYMELGQWTWVSTSAPVSGQFYVEAGEIRIFDTNADGTAKGTELAAVAIGDRFQFGDVNAFEVTSVGVAGGNTYWGFAGEWAEPFVIGDFSGDYQIRHIKSDNVLVRNNAVKQRFLKLDDNLQVISNDPDESIELIWSGTVTTTTIALQTINAGKKFSDYTHVLFVYAGLSNRRVHEVRVELWDTLRTIELPTTMTDLEGGNIAFRHMSDTTFQLASGGGSATLEKIYGYRSI